MRNLFIAGLVRVRVLGAYSRLAVVFTLELAMCATAGRRHIRCEYITLGT